MFQMMGVFAEFERSIIQERIRAGLQRAKEDGKKLGRPRLSMVAGSGNGIQSRQEARFGLQPLTDYAGTSFTIGRAKFIQFDAERVLNDLGGLFAVVTVDGLFQQVTHLRSRTSHNRHQAPKIGPASRHDNLRFFVGDAYEPDFRAPRFKQDSHKLDHHASAAFRFARRQPNDDLADRSGRLRQLHQQRSQQPTTPNSAASSTREFRS